MVVNIERKQYTPRELARRWSAHAWKGTPSVMIALPFPGGVLFGAEGPNSDERVSFFLDPQEALVIGQRLINAAKEGGAR